MNERRRLPLTPEPMHLWRGFRDVKIAGDSWGDAKGPLVVLQHGGGQTRHAWRGTGELLGNAGYHAIAYDSRGHGDSAWAPDGDYSQDARVEDLKHILVQLGGKRPILVGASMGAGISLVAVGENHVDAVALVLVDYAAQIDPEGVERIRTFLHANADGFSSLDDVADAIASYQPQRNRRRRVDGLAKNVRIGDNGRYYWHWDPQTIMGNRLKPHERQLRLEASARNVTIPTLLVRGGLSDVLTEGGVKAFLEVCPRAEYVEVQGAAHMVAGDRNDLFTTAVVDFLARAA